jgi:hypothetical protein
LIVIGGPYVTYSEITGLKPTEADVASLLFPMDVRAVLFILGRMNLHFRLARAAEDKNYKQAVGEAQAYLFNNFTDEELFEQIKSALKLTKTHERALFHPLQILNVARCAVKYCKGKNSSGSVTDEDRFAIGRCCLMMNELLTTDEENAKLSHGSANLRIAELMTQLLPGFETNNPGDLSSFLNRSMGAFNLLLSDQTTRNESISKSGNYDLVKRFHELTGVELDRWVAIVFSCVAYFNQYLGEDGSQQNIDFLTIAPSVFVGSSKITEADLRLVLGLISQSISDCAAAFEVLQVPGSANITPFIFRPLIQIEQGFICSDVGFLIAKLFAGAYWTLHDREDRSGRTKLAIAWGVIFERYVNWWVQGHVFPKAISFYPFPMWTGKRKGKSKRGSEEEAFDAVILQDSRLVALECKGGFLRLDAKYSMDLRMLLRDLNKKIAKAGRQLAKNLDDLFGINPKRQLRDIPTTHVTRVIPVIVVQDQALRSLAVGWWINRQFQREMRRVVLRPGVTIEAVTLIHIEEFEILIDSAEGPEFDLVATLQLRNLRDPEAMWDLQEFLATRSGYGTQHSTRRKELEEEFRRCVLKYAFDISEETSKA